MLSLLKKIGLFRLAIAVCILLPLAFGYADYYMTWINKVKAIYYYNERDLYVMVLAIIPTILGHLLALWGHYFRAEREFQNAIAKVTAPTHKKQQLALWERHLWGRPVRFWIAAFFLITLQIVWFAVPMIKYTESMIARSGLKAGLSRQIGNASGYTIVACAGCLLFLVLRRSMLHALGFTYAEIIPLHRWLGAAIVFWGGLHGITYFMYYAWARDSTLAKSLDFNGRGMMNLMGVLSYCACVLLGLAAFPWVRRKCYILFIGTHRVFTAIFFVGMILHFPSPMLWYYILPSFILFLVDRFVPKMIQARTIHPEATCTFNADADIIRVTFTSDEPMKPYYPGDYITVQVPEIGTLYHPFTIASYWAEDPYSMTLFIRTFNESRLSWTAKLAKLCGSEDKRIRVRANVDGVFGDRRHDYLKSEVLILFVAGAAITTFMALIKAIAAQIAASNEPLRMQLHMICTFRTRSELHAYGSFLHQITRDPRFTSWLHVEIYVSRPDKPSTLMGPHAHVVKNDVMVPNKNSKGKGQKKKRFASIKRTGTMLKRALSGRTIVVPSTEDNVKGSTTASGSSDLSRIDAQDNDQLRRSGSVHTVNTVVDLEAIAEHPEEGGKGHGKSVSVAASTAASTADPSSSISSGSSASSTNEKAVATVDAEPLSASTPTREMTYDDRRLPTFQASHSTAVAKHLAKLDLATSTFLILFPLAVWLCARTIPWEGTSRWCATNKTKGNLITVQCRWSYAFLPGLLHVVAMTIAGYAAVFMARRALLRKNRKDVEKAVPYPDLEKEDERLAVEDGNWDEGDVVYSHGRMNVKKCIEEFVAAGVGQQKTNGEPQGLVSVFGGGPDGFVDMVEKHVRQAKWKVDFHRETWAP
ncbi:hypothetical protein BGW42_007211 [Actinomortierella wolfii]|nr:hypothetical protein BGW42_007211 [Actinomortierella wolfii]